jgi:hypothetical protein
MGGYRSTTLSQSGAAALCQLVKKYGNERRLDRKPVLAVGQETIQPVLAYQILRRFVRPLVSVLTSDIDVLMNNLDAWIELRLDAPLFQPYRQVLNLVMPQF